MITCGRCIYKPFCQSSGYVCSSFKDKDRYADRNEVIREFAERLKALKIKPEFPWDDFVVTEGAIDALVKEMTEEA